MFAARSQQAIISNDRILRKVTLKFKDSITEFVRSPDSFLPQYSLVNGFDGKFVREVSEEYTYPMELEPKLISKQFERAGIQTPSPSTVEDMIRSAE